MAMTDDIWEHGPISSEAKWRGLKLKVTSGYTDRESTLSDLWGWEVVGKDSKSFSRAVDRIGACVEAEEAAQKMIRNVFVKHGILDEDEGKKKCSICNATDAPMKQVAHKWLCYDDLNCFDRAKENREEDSP